MRVAYYKTFDSFLLYIKKEGTLPQGRCVIVLDKALTGEPTAKDRINPAKHRLLQPLPPLIVLTESSDTLAHKDMEDWGALALIQKNDNMMIRLSSALEQATGVLLVDRRWRRVKHAASLFVALILLGAIAWLVLWFLHAR